jgi:type VI secretion system secreted protein Hcp
MQHKYFLKLDGVRGESQSARHLGEIEISSFTWGNKNPQLSNVGRGRASFSDLIITKPQDVTSPILWVACHTGQSFAQAFLTTEELSERGNLVRSTIVALASVMLESMSVVERGETISLNFENAKMMRG